MLSMLWSLLVKEGRRDCEAIMEEERELAGECERSGVTIPDANGVCSTGVLDIELRLEPGPWTL